MPQISSNIRNVVMILVIAGLVDVVPGGGDASSTALEFVYLAFFGAFVFVATRLYREHRTTIYSLGTQRRAVAYAAVGVLAVLFTGFTKFWDDLGAAGNITWLVLFVAAIYALVEVVRGSRRY